LEELAGGGVVMVKSLLSQLLHRYIYCNLVREEGDGDKESKEVCPKIFLRQEVMLCIP